MTCQKWYANPRLYDNVGGLGEHANGYVSASYTVPLYLVLLHSWDQAEPAPVKRFSRVLTQEGYFWNDEETVTHLGVK